VHSPVFCVCTECDFSWCAACGLSNSQSERKGRRGSHVRREAENYRIYGIMADLESIHTEYTKGTVNSNEYATGNVNSNEYAVGIVDSKEYATVNVDSNEYTTVNANSNEYTIGNVNFHEYATETGNSDDYPTEIVNSGYTTIAVSSIEYTPVTVNSNRNLSIAPHDFDHDWTTTISMGGYWSPFDRTNHGKKTV